MVAKNLAKDIKITSGEAGKQTLVFAASKKYTKEQLVAAMGKKKDQFVVEAVSTEG